MWNPLRPISNERSAFINVLTNLILPNNQFDELLGYIMEFDNLRLGDVISHNFEVWKQSIHDQAKSKLYGLGKYKKSGIPDYLHCKVSGVPKPAGVRIVTVHDHHMAAVCQPAQDQLLGSIKRSPHSTMVRDLATDLTEIARNSEKLRIKYQHIDDEWQWISGDYKSATDKLKMSTTISSLESLKGIGLLEFDDLIRSLSPMTIHYPSKWPKRQDLENEKKIPKSPPEKGEVLQQTNGQLMGHWLSFALLCSINYATIILTAKRWLGDPACISPEIKKFRNDVSDMILHNVKVNGDDIAFRCPLSFYNEWLLTIGEFGFKVSMGKNYKVPDFVMINTRYFRMINVRKDIEMREFGYYNVKLIHGKSTTLDHMDNGYNTAPTPDMIGMCFSKMVDKCPEAIHGLPLAMTCKGRHFDKTKFRPQWFLPAHLGGYGVDIRHSTKIHLTRFQRLVASWMVLHPDESSLYTSPRTGDRSREVVRLSKLYGRVVLVPDERVTLDPSIEESLIINENEVNSMINNIHALYTRNYDIDRKIEYHYKENIVSNTISIKDCSDSWKDRALAINRAMAVKVKTLSAPKMARQEMMSENQWFSPISDEGLARYWVPDYRMYATAKCRPIGVIHGSREDYRTRLYNKERMILENDNTLKTFFDPDKFDTLDNETPLYIGGKLYLPEIRQIDFDDID